MAIVRDNESLRNLRRLPPRNAVAAPTARYIELPNGGGSAVAGSYAKITAYAGTEVPFRYSAQLVKHDGSEDFDPDNFTAAGGIDLSWKIVNSTEIGPGGLGAAPLQVGSIVRIEPLPGSAGMYVCTAINNRGVWL